MFKKFDFNPYKTFSYYPELVLFASFIFSILHLDQIKFDSTMSLHLSRTIQWLQFESISWQGPELADNSLRLIGPFYYWIIGLFWTLTRSIEGLVFASILFSFICFYLLCKSLKKKLGPIGILVWTLLVFLTPFIFKSLRTIDSSSLALGICSLIFVQALKFQDQKSKTQIIITTIVCALGLQIHLSVIAPCLAFFASTLIQQSKVQRLHLFSLIWLAIGSLLFPLTHEMLSLSLPASFLLIQIHDSFLLKNLIFKNVFLGFSLCIGLLSFSLTIKNHFIKVEDDRNLISNLMTTELNLKIKKFIYSLTAADGSDPFVTVHGRVANKMRQEEMNLSQTKAYFGLYNTLYDKNVTYSQDLANQSPSSSWLFQLRSKKEISLGAESPYLMTEIKTQSLPQNTIIKYLNEKSQGIEKVSWKNSNLILPFAFIRNPEEAKIVRLEFKIDSPTDKYLNLLIDSEEKYKLLQVKLNRKVQAAIEHYPGNAKLQSQYIFKIPDNVNQAKVTIELKVLTEEIPNYSRLDIFTSGYLLASEF